MFTWNIRRFTLTPLDSGEQEKYQSRFLLNYDVFVTYEYNKIYIAIYDAFTIDFITKNF